MVADDGEGFPMISQEALFQPFAMTPGAGSSGIGLAISRSIVEARDGTMAASNQAVGGAQVTIGLPT